MDSKCLLHRQIHPSFVINGIVSNQAFIEYSVSSGAFMPTAKDNNKLSVYNGEKFTAKDSFDHFTTTYSSVGVLSVTVEEVISIQLSVLNDDIPFEGHASIDFEAIVSKNQKSIKAAKLRDYAVNRGWTYKII